LSKERYNIIKMLINKIIVCTFVYIAYSLQNCSVEFEVAIQYFTPGNSAM